MEKGRRFGAPFFIWRPVCLLARKYVALEYCFLPERPTNFGQI
jgi:hypothetical protein